MGQCRLKMEPEELENYCAVMKRFNVGELAIGDIRIVRDANGLTPEDMNAALASSGVKEASDDEILMDPFAGLEGIKQ